MKNQVNKTNKKKSLNIKTTISNMVRAELPKMHLKYLKIFKGNHNFINKFIHVPDIINGGDSDNMKDFNRNTHDVGQYLSTKSIQYDLIGFSLDKSMHLKFQYLFQDKDSGLCSIAWLIETTKGWEVNKIEAYD
jgi:hypothetical protein